MVLEQIKHPNLRTVYTDNTELTETEFLRREFGLVLKTVSLDSFSLDVNSFDDVCAIASTNPILWKPILNRLPVKSVIFFLLGNETYEPKIYESLNDISSILFVFIYNPPTRIAKWTLPATIIGDLIDSFPISSFSEMKEILLDANASRGLKNKFRDTTIKYPWFPLPQGYSNSFCLGLKKLGYLTDENSSIISKDFRLLLKSSAAKRKSFIFVGQETNRRRRLIVEWLGHLPNSTIVSKRNGFGGAIFDGDTSYVTNLLTAWFNVIPPGYFNNSNHRYTESCIVGSIPVILSHNSIDRSTNDNWTNSLNLVRSHSFKLLVKWLQKQDEAGLITLSNSISAKDLGKIYLVRNLFCSLTNTSFQSK